MAGFRFSPGLSFPRPLGPLDFASVRQNLGKWPYLLNLVHMVPLAGHLATCLQWPLWPQPRHTASAAGQPCGLCSLPQLLQGFLLGDLVGRVLAFTVLAFFLFYWYWEMTRTAGGALRAEVVDLAASYAWHSVTASLSVQKASIEMSFCTNISSRTPVRTPCLIHASLLALLLHLNRSTSSDRLFKRT